MRYLAQLLLLFLFLTTLAGVMPRLAFAQENTEKKTDTPADEAPSEQSNDDTPLTIFPHSETSRYWISGQANIVFQWHPTFPAKYSGTNSLSPGAQSATTHILTLYMGYQLTHTTEVLADIEDATGGGIGSALGLAGFTDLDSVRTVQGVALSKAPYLARLMLHQIIPLSDDRISAERGPLAWPLRSRRGELNFG